VDCNERFFRAIEKRFQVSIPRDWNYRFKKNLVLKNYLSLHFDTEFAWPEPQLPIIGGSGTCYGLRSHFGVLVDGTVVPCCLDKEGNIPLGNVKNSASAVSILRGFKKRVGVTEIENAVKSVKELNSCLGDAR